MKKFSKVLAMILALTMVLAMFAFVACEPKQPDEPTPDNPAEKTVVKDVTMWVSESAGVAELTLEQVKAYNALEDAKYSFDLATLKIEGVTEGDSASKMITDVETGADIYCFAQDQLARLVQAGALAQPGVKATETIKTNNDAGAVAAATMGDKVMAYPLTSDNGYFMFYDKRVITDESHLEDLALLVADCEAAGKNIVMETETSAWYIASFFFATGCHSNWNIDNEGKPLSIDDTFNSPEGLIAMKGMQQLVKSSNYISSSDAAEFGKGAAVVVTGTWGVDAAIAAVGADNLGYTDLPSFTVDGKSYHLGSYSGNKLMGVKPSKDSARAAALADLALYLTNEECQLARFNKVSWGPSNINAQASEAVKKNPALVALAKQNAHATPQGQIDGSWWDIAKVLGTAAKEAALNDEAALQAALDKYVADISAVINMDDSDANRWTVIGSINGDGWSKDLEMKEKPAGTWTTAVPYYLTEGTMFKVRKGLKWSNGETGTIAADSSEYAETTDDNDKNAKVKVTGLYLIKYDTTAQEISLVPVTAGVVGTINNWGNDGVKDTVLAPATPTEGAIAAFSAEVEFAAGAEFKVRYNDSWDFGDFGKDGGNIKIETAGKYTVTLTLKADYTWELTYAPVAA